MENLTCLKTLCDFYMWKHKFQYVGWSTVVSIEQMHWISTVVENGFTNAQLHLRLSYWQNLDCHSAVQKTRRAHTRVLALRVQLHYQVEMINAYLREHREIFLMLHAVESKLLWSYNSFTLTVETPHSRILISVPRSPSASCLSVLCSWTSQKTLGIQR